MALNFPDVDMNEVPYGIINRRVVFCPWMKTSDLIDVFLTCRLCDRFTLYCYHCSDPSNYFQPDGKRMCPFYANLVFTDGACRNNGRMYAQSGVGMAAGNDSQLQRSFPITDSEDDFHVRSNQRAELVGAMLGLDFLIELEEGGVESPLPGTKSENRRYIVATDSEYVVKGMTEWLPKWKENGWRTSKRSLPTNIDLFQKFDKKISLYEREGYDIGFLHVPRKYNEVADQLSKEAANLGDVALAFSN
ncbi:MAG: hypothetical protein Q9227_002211 [Pyrenula ochraceoflavens]